MVEGDSADWGIYADSAHLVALDVSEPVSMFMFGGVGCCKVGFGAVCCGAVVVAMVGVALALTLGVAGVVWVGV